MIYKRDTTIFKDLENLCIDNIPRVCGELDQLEYTMFLLDGLLGWCELWFNTEQEEKDYELLVQAYKLLEQVHKNYKEYR